MEVLNNHTGFVYNIRYMHVLSRHVLPNAKKSKRYTYEEKSTSGRLFNSGAYNARPCNMKHEKIAVTSMGSGFE